LKQGGEFFRLSPSIKVGIPAGHYAW
jgi:isopenicillin N synthase-like dioxygenase